MANRTITVDAETLKRARIRALERGESVNAYLTDQLRRYTEDESALAREQAAAERLVELSTTLSGTSSGRSWSRGDLYDDRRTS